MNKEKAYENRINEIASVIHDIQYEMERGKITAEEAVEQAYAEFGISDIPNVCEHCGELILKEENETTVEYKGNVVILHEDCREEFEEDNNV